MPTASPSLMDALWLAVAEQELEVAMEPPPLPDWLANPALFAAHLANGRWVRAPHLDTIAETLADVPIRPVRLIVELPPRHGKSEMISHWFPVWLLERDPRQRVILSSYEADFAKSWGRKVRNTIQEHADQLRVRLAEDSVAAGRWDTPQGGGMVTAGAGGSITGRGTSCLVVDDPIKNAEQAHSQIYRDKLWEWWQSTAYTRLEPGASAVVLMTRWHEDDLVGRLLDQMTKGGDQWQVIRLPALAEGADPLGREPGAALWPERYNVAALAAIKATVSDWVWSALYQQRPAPAGGSIFLRDWWAGRNRYDHAAPAMRQRTIGRYLSFDTAFKESDTSAYTACVVGELLADYRLLVREVWRDRLAFPALMDRIEGTARRYAQDGKLRGVVIEDRASGTSAYQTLRAQAPDWLAPLLVAFNPTGSKTERAQQAAVWCRNGCVWLPDPSESVPWLHEYESELLAAPNGTWMDMVDATSQLVIYLEHILSQGWHARGEVSSEEAA